MTNTEDFNRKSNKIKETKENIRVAINLKGVTLEENAPFDEYPNAISSIVTESVATGLLPNTAIVI